MSKRGHGFAVTGLLLLAAAGRTGTAVADAGAVTFEGCVAARVAIERVYHSHQSGRTLAFSQAVPRSALERKVRTHLRQSAALELFWNRPLSAADVREERERIERDTRMPDKLGEIYEALDGDARIIDACYVRPILVDRLVREAYARDPRLHAGARQRAERLRRMLASQTIDPRASDPDRWVTNYVLDGRPAAPRPAAAGRTHRIGLPTRAFEQRRRAAQKSVGSVGEVLERREAFVVEIVLAADAQLVAVATYVVPKTPWDAWWRSLEPDPLSVRGDDGWRSLEPYPLSVRGDDGWRSLEPDPLSVRGDDGWRSLEPDPLRVRGDDGWRNLEPDPLSVRGDAAQDRAAAGSSAEHDGFSGECSGEVWGDVAQANAPAARDVHTAVWTGNEMIVWGGRNSAYLDTGGRYDPVSDSWTPTSTVDAPAPRAFHTAIWTGDEMIVWGGFGGSDENSGGRYDPVSDSWTPTAMTDAPAARDSHCAVWTGAEMIVWGGYRPILVALNTGGRYDPATDTWSATSTNGAPSARASQTAVWTGAEMIVWGGIGGGFQNTGGRYDPQADAWTPTSTSGAAVPRDGHGAIWTGAEMIVWGGYDGAYLNDGGRYAPATNSWTATALADAPAPRTVRPVVWTGSEMVVWGGYDGEYLDTGGRYRPAADAWSVMQPVDTPTARWNATSVWTGSEMIVWGGAATTFFEDGGGYGLSVDNDQDGVCTEADCSDESDQVWGVPGEVRALDFADEATLVWTAPAEPGGTLVLYDVVRSALAHDFVTSATCVASDELAASVVDPDVPAAASAFYYLARAQNTCPDGQGSPGRDSAATPRQARTCP